MRPFWMARNSNASLRPKAKHTRLSPAFPSPRLRGSSCSNAILANLHRCPNRRTSAWEKCSMWDLSQHYSLPDELRSRIMRSNKSRGNKSTEVALLCLFRSNRVSGWRRGASLIGRPDFVFRHERVAIFVDGCYWHGCKCRRPPKKNYSYWQSKFEANRAHDKRVTRQLRAQGWRVLRFWEHQLKTRPGWVVKRIEQALQNSRTASGGL